MIQRVNINTIKANPSNPRVIKDDKFKLLVKSIKDFPEMLELRPIVVNSENIILGGNMRLRACKEAGLTEVPIIYASSLDQDKQNEFIIKDNVGFGEWDWEMLANEWDTDLLADWGLEVPTIIDPVEPDDLSDDIHNLYRIEITCKDEEHQEKTYNKMIEMGYECRLLTL